MPAPNVPIRVGMRVRLRQSMYPGAEQAQESGTVTRSDPRGVVVKLDSGRQFICEPASLTILDDPPTPPGDGAT